MVIVGLIIDFLLLALSFGALHYISENYFIESLDHLSKKLRMSSDMAGSTLMAAGSSAPELAVALFAIFMGGNHEAIGVGTIVGSALFNILAITGVVMLARKTSKLQWQPILRDIIFYILAVIMLGYIFSQGKVDMVAGIVLVLLYVFYIAIVYFWKRILPYEDKEVEIIAKAEKHLERKSGIFAGIKTFNVALLKYQFFAFIISIGLITAFSWLLVRSAIGISEALRVPELLIGLTIVAIGTSVPDMISSWIVARQGRPGMAINNAIGSNTFDILIGLGLPFLLYVIVKGEGFAVVGDDLLYSVAILLGSATIIFLFFVLSKWKTSKVMGIVLIILYVLYLGHIIYINLI